MIMMLFGEVVWEMIKNANEDNKPKMILNINWINVLNNNINC